MPLFGAQAALDPCERPKITSAGPE